MKACQDCIFYESIKVDMVNRLYCSKHKDRQVQLHIARGDDKLCGKNGRNWKKRQTLRFRP